MGSKDIDLISTGCCADGEGKGRAWKVLVIICDFNPIVVRIRCPEIDVERIFSCCNDLCRGNCSSLHPKCTDSKPAGLSIWSKQTKLKQGVSEVVPSVADWLCENDVLQTVLNTNGDRGIEK